MFDKGTRIYIAGHQGLVGAGLLRLYRRLGFTHLITESKAASDLRDPGTVVRLFERERPEVVFIAAAKVGGIRANMAAPVDFLQDNLLIQCNLLRQCQLFEVRRVMVMGSSCIYPRNSPQPMTEDLLLTGAFEPTNEGYALAKVCGLKLAQYYHQQFGLDVVCPIPCNVYGTGDHFDLERSHVLSSLIRRFVEAVETGQSEVILWGTGTARREFIHVDDLCRGLHLLMTTPINSGPINIGSRKDISIYELAHCIARAVSYKGDIRWDATSPDGMPRKLLDVTRMTEMGFEPVISLEEGIKRTIKEYRQLRSRNRILSLEKFPSAAT